MFSRYDQVSLTHVIRLVGWQKRVMSSSFPFQLQNTIVDECVKAKLVSLK